MEHESFEHRIEKLETTLEDQHESINVISQDVEDIKQKINEKYEKNQKSETRRLQEKLFKKLHKNNEKKRKQIRRVLKKRYRFRNSVQFLICIIFIAIVIILLSNFFVTLHVIQKSDISLSGSPSYISDIEADKEGESYNGIYYSEYSYLSSDSILQSTIISTGLSVIGIAISVFVGLSIIQVIEKGQLEEFSKKYDSYEQEQKRTNKDKFFSELNKEDREDTKYFYELFLERVEKKDDIPSNLYYEMTCIEESYNKLYHKQFSYKNKFDDFSIVALLDYVSEVEAFLENNRISSASENAIREYIKCREANYYFNRGYDNTNPEADEYFHKVIERYKEIYELNMESGKPFKCQRLTDISNKFEYMNIGYEYEINVLNILAESYSKNAYKMIYPDDKNITEEQFMIADQALDCSIKIYEYIEELHAKKYQNEEGGCEKHPLKEVIYRNHGAAIERKIKAQEKCTDFIDKAMEDGNIEKIILAKEKYQKAMDIALVETSDLPRRETLYLAYAGLYIKVVKYYCGLSEIRNLKRGDHNSIYKFEKLKFDDWTNKVSSYIKLALYKNPINRVFNISLCYALIWKAFFATDSDRANLYMYLAEQAYESALLLYKDNDPLRKEFDTNYHILNDCVKNASLH